MTFDEEMRAAAEGYLAGQMIVLVHDHPGGCIVCKAMIDGFLAGARAALKSELMREVRQALGDTVELARFNHMLAGPMKKCELALTALERAVEVERED